MIPKLCCVRIYKHSPLTIVSWFVRRWQVEITFQEARRTLGVETRRPCSDWAIARTTPCLPAVFSRVTLLADRLVRQGTLALPKEAWHTKPRPTFADALTAVRQHYGAHMGLRVSPRQNHIAKLPQTLRKSLIYALCRAACWPKSSEDEYLQTKLIAFGELA